MIKRSITILCVLLLFTSLTACSKNTSVPDSTESVHNEVNNNTKDESNSDIKPQNEVAGSDQSASDTTGKNENDDNTNDNNVATGGSGKIEDYWEGDSYFDLVSFSMDNGCKSVWYIDKNAVVNFKNESVAVQYEFGYPGPWIIRPGISNCYILYGKDNNTPEYMVLVNNIGEAPPEFVPVSVSKKNDAKLSPESIRLFAEILKCLEKNKESMDPLSDSGLNYTQTY